jgi:hypothetical protein
MRKSDPVRIVLLIGFLCLVAGCAFQSSHQGAGDYRASGDDGSNAMVPCSGNVDDEVIVEVELVQLKKEIVVRPKEVCVYKDAKPGWVSQVKWVLLNAREGQTLVIQGPPRVFNFVKKPIHDHDPSGKSGPVLAGAPEGRWNYNLWVEQDGKDIGMSVDPSVIIKKIEEPLGDPPDELPFTIRN